MTCAAIITAGGLGLRMGADRPKQYLEVSGIPILARTIAVYDGHPLIDSIVVTVPESDQSYCQKNIIEKFRFGKVRSVAPGGATRQASVFNGLKWCVDSEIVAIHDGVRPFVSSNVISSAIGCALEMGACLAALPVTETVKKKVGRSLETIPRDGLWLARTPQVFQTRLIMRAHELAAERNIEVTDDASLMEFLGHEVGIIEDNFYNLKITSRDDMTVAELIARAPEFAFSSGTGAPD